MGSILKLDVYLIRVVLMVVALVIRLVVLKVTKQNLFELEPIPTLPTSKAIEHP